MRAGKLRDRVEFQQRGSGTDSFGGQSTAWTPQFERAAEFIHLRGDEDVNAGRIGGSEIYKLKVRSSAAVRATTTDGWRVRDTRRDVVYNITSIDAVTDRQWAWLMIEQTQT